MRISKFILLLFIFKITTFSIIAQENSLNKDPSKTLIKDEFYDKTPLSQVLNDLVTKYQLTIEYDKTEIARTNITYWFADVNALDGLKKALKGTPFKVSVNDKNQLFIMSKSQFIEKNADSKYEGSAQKKDFTLSGKITDAATGETLPFATISIKNSKNNSQTNVDGIFTLFKVPSDTSSLEISYIGFKNRTFKLNPNIKFDNFIIELEPSVGVLNEVIIEGEKTEVVKANEIVGMIKMTPKNIAKLPNVGERDPFRAFQLMPGVSASNESSSGLYVRGGTPDQTLVLYDGFTVYHVDHLFGFFSAFNYNAIKDIQLYRGGFDAKFGGRISGVAEITGKDGNKKEFNAGADLSLLSVNGFVETPIGDKATLLVAGRRSYKGPLYNKIFDSFADQQETNNQGGAPGGTGGGFGGGFGAFSNDVKANSYFYDINSKFTYRPSQKDILSLSFYNGTDDMDNSTSTSFSGRGSFGGGGGGGLSNFNTSTTDVSNWGNTGSSLKWSRNWGKRLYSNSLVSYSNYFSNRDNTRNISLPTSTDQSREIKIGQLEDNNLNDLSLKTDFEFKLNPSNQLEFGGHYTANRIEYKYSQNDTTTILDRNDEGKITAFYVQDKIKIGGTKLQITPGIRATNFDVTGKTYFEPRLNANFNVTSKFKIKGAAGIYYQIVKQINREDISAGNRNFWILANDSNLPVTQSNHLILGGSYETKNYLLDVEFYQKQNSNITEYTLRFVRQIGLGLQADETFFNGSETIKGVDVLLQKKYGSFNGWLAYTFSESKRNIAAFSDKPYYSDQDVRHQFKAVGSYKVKKWDLAATLVYSTGRPYTSIIGAYSIDLLDNTKRDFTNPSDKNANRLPDYHRLDLSATYNFNHNFNVGFSVFNVYNRTNVWYKRYEVINDNDVSYLNTTNVNYLGFTPNVILSWKLK
ncbi:MAG: TonB-dependent receptor [Leadbetterella sp.]